MASLDARLQENVPGPYYVDEMCIDCDLCRTLAPDNFTQAPDGGFSYVSKQPEGAEEEAACREALQECPTRAIGDDGGEAPSNGA